MSTTSPLGFVWEYLKNNNSSLETKSKVSLDSKEESFIQILRCNNADVWKSIFDKKDRIICCPISNSLGSESFPKDYLLSHIIEEGSMAGEYCTLNNQTVHVSGSYLICGAGFKESRKVKILSFQHINYNNVRAAVYFINRPLIGGLLSPEESEEISKQMMSKYIATLRSFPELESSFKYLSDKVKLIKTNYLNITKDIKKDYNDLRNLLIKDLKDLWLQISNKILQTGDLTSILSGLDTIKLI